MSTPWKKRVERFYLDSFLQKAKWSCQVEDSECPDFVLQFPEKRVGIELTMLFKDETSQGSFQKRQESTRLHFLAKCAKAYYSQGGAPLKVNAIMNTSTLGREQVQKVVGYLLKHRPAVDMESTTFHLELSPGTRSKFFLDALPTKFGQYTFWQVINNSVGWVKKLEQEVLEAKIQEKALRLPVYRKVADSVMLLIVAERTQSSGMLEFTPLSSALPTQGFSEVHLLIEPIDTWKLG